MKVVMGEKSVDIAGAFPATLGDMIDLEDKGLVNNDGKPFTMKQAAQLTLFFVQKVDPTITDADVRSLHLNAVTPIAEYIKSRMEEEDKPNPTS